MILITVLEILCFLSALTSCALGFFVYAKDSRSPVNRLFLFCMLGAAYWAVGEFFFWQAGSYEAAVFWLKFSSFWPVAVVLTAHFILAYTGHPLALPEKKRFLIVCLYVPAILLSLIGLFTNLLYMVVYGDGPGYVYSPNMANPVYIACCVFIVMVMAGAIVACMTALRHAPAGRKRRHVQIVCIAIATAIFFGVLSGLILPLFHIFAPNLIFIGLLLFSLIITYAITQYGLFTLSPETALADILRTMPDGLILLSPDGRITTVNASTARILQADEKFITGQALSRFIREPAYSRILSAAREQGTFLDIEAVLDACEKSVVSIAGSPVRNPDGDLAGIVLIIRDISCRKMQEKALRVANEKISLLTHLTRHDINNLVTGLSGYLLLLEDMAVEPPGDAYVRTSIGLVDKITRHLRFSSEYLHLGTYHPDWQPLGPMVEHAAGSLMHDLIEIVRDLPEVEIYADPLTVKAFYNLLDNALHHGKHVTGIRVSAHDSGDGTLVVTVEDNGCGIPDAKKESVFRYGVGDHTGFGLAFTRDILEVTGITIRETGIFGKGARFEIRVPQGAWRQA